MPSTSASCLEFPIISRNSYIFGYTLLAFHWTNRKPLGRSPPNLQLSFTVSSSANGICDATTDDVSAAGSIVVTADGIETFSNEVSCGTYRDAVTDATVDLALITPNLDDYSRVSWYGRYLY